VFDGFHGEIDVEIRPVQVMWTRKLDVRDLANGRLAEPGKVPERYEHLSLADEQPESV
jgi:hypothetical protein